MARKSKIEWTGTTWNPTTGCTKCSPGCANCYAETMSRRLKAMGQKMYKDGFEVRTHLDRLAIPLRWTKPKMVFVNSMSDLFHEKVPVDFIASVFAAMALCPKHIFQILTKRTLRASEIINRNGGYYLFDKVEIFSHKIRPKWSDELDYVHLNEPFPNVWIGTSVENRDVISRIDDLRDIHWKNKFLSIEPLLGPLGNLNLKWIGWVIAGGESGFNARPTHPDWVREIRDQCADAKVPFFFKQWGEWWPAGKGIVENARMITMGSEAFYRIGKKQAGRMLDGRIHEGMPDDMRKIKPFFVEG